MRRKVKPSVGEYYHIYNRGVEKRKIFLEKRDFDRFSKTMRLANGKTPLVFKTIQGRGLDEVDLGERLVAIGAYVLMPNHFHILAKETKENGLTNFMSKLTTSYAMYFNKKYERVGSLLQGRFKIEHIDSDVYLKYLFAYIHLNPMKLYKSDWREKGIRDIKEAEKFINQYQHSSFLDFLGVSRPENTILSLNKFPKHFSNKYVFMDFHRDWLNYKDNPSPVLG